MKISQFSIFSSVPKYFKLKKIVPAAMYIKIKNFKHFLKKLTKKLLL